MEGTKEAGGAKSYVIGNVTTLIRDARQLDNAAHVVCDRGGNVELMEKMLRDLYAEIGERICAVVEVDA